MSNNNHFTTEYNQSGGTANFSALFAQPSTGAAPVTDTTATVTLSGGNLNILGFITAAPKSSQDKFIINATGGTIHSTRQLIIDQSSAHNGTTDLVIDGSLVRIDQGFATQNSGGTGKLDVNLTSGTLQSRTTFNGTTFAAPGGTFTVNSGGTKTIQLTSNATNDLALGAITLNDTLNISNQSTTEDITQTGSWSGTGSVIINEGILLMNGSYDSTGLLTVQDGATLKGNTSFDGAVLNQGSLELGSTGLGVMIFNDDLTLASTIEVMLDITGVSGGQFERLIGDGSNIFTADGILSLDNTGYSAILGDSITILSNWDTIGGSFDSINGLDLGGGLSWDVSNLLTNGSITVVPEPSTYAVSLALITVVLAMARRKR